jgi:steroid 5-alpha reductase family enzyme
MSFTALLNLTSRIRSPFLRTLLPSIGLAYAFQAAVAVPSIALQTERVYDLSGSLTYISVTALSLALPTLRARAAAAAASGSPKPAWPSALQALTTGSSGAWNWRMVVLTAAVTIWATRLGSYLFQRIREEKVDSRFDKIRGKPAAFAVAFFAQATVSFLTLFYFLSFFLASQRIFTPLIQ